MRIVLLSHNYEKILDRDVPALLAVQPWLLLDQQLYLLLATPEEEAIYRETGAIQLRDLMAED